MIIALATDRAFVELAGVLIRSICARGNVPEARIVVFADRLRSIDKKKLAACADRPVSFIDVGEMVTQRAHGLRTSIAWPPVVYARLLAPDLIPDTGRMLYLDSDTVVNDDLRPLFEIDLGGMPVAACQVEEGHFNSGVLVIDLDMWRRERIGDQAISYARTYQPDYVDQGALNGVLQDRYRKLDRRWNLMRKHAAAFESAAIIHYTWTKPNSAECTNPARGVFLAHRAHTPWANKPLISVTEAKLSRLWQKIRRIAGKLKFSASGLNP